MVCHISKIYSNEQMLERAFYRVAWNVHHMWEETGASDTRLFQEPIISDKMVLVGESKKGGTYREHIVPRVFICAQCHAMFEHGESIDSVARFIRKYLKIVLISQEEQQLLDTKKASGGLGLRETMPEGWSGSPFERLDFAKIEYSLYSNML